MKKRSYDKDQWRTGLTNHRIYMRRLYKRPETSLQGLVKMLDERKKKKGEDDHELPERQE